MGTKKCFLKSPDNTWRRLEQDVVKIPDYFGKDFIAPEVKQHYAASFATAPGPGRCGQGVVVPIRGHNDIVPAGSHGEAGRWSWHLMPPATPDMFNNNGLKQG